MFTTIERSRRLGVGLALLAAGALLAGCRDHGPDNLPGPTSGRIRLLFDHRLGDGSRLVLGQPFQTTNDEPVQLSNLRYYVSNVRLKRADSTVWTLPNGYFLIDATRRDTATVRGIPFGQYVQLLFDIGVDSAANSRNDHTGDLDPARGMYWAWNTGYMFFWLEGKWLGATPAAGLEYHIGLAPTLRTVRLRLPQPLTLGRDMSPPRATLTVRPLAIFDGPNRIDLRDDQYRNVMFDTDYARRVADNYATMFALTAVE